MSLRCALSYRGLLVGAFVVLGVFWLPARASGADPLMGDRGALLVRGGGSGSGRWIVMGRDGRSALGPGPLGTRGR